MTRNIFFALAFAALIMLSAVIAVPARAQEPEAIVQGVIIDESTKIGYKWWDVKIQHIISDNSGTLAVGNIVRVGMYIVPPYPKQSDKVTIGEQVEVYGKGDAPGINLNGEAYYLIKIISVGGEGEIASLKSLTLIAPWIVLVISALAVGFAITRRKLFLH